MTSQGRDNDSVRPRGSSDTVRQRSEYSPLCLYDTGQRGPCRTGHADEIETLN